MRPLSRAVLVLLLAGGSISGAWCESRLDAHLSVGGPLTQRLMIDLVSGPRTEMSRAIAWTESDAEQVLRRPPVLALDLPWVDAGPLLLEGGTAELFRPHPVSAASTAWQDESRARVDAGMDPVGRRGVCFHLHALPVSLALLRHNETDSVAATVGFPAVSRDPTGRTGSGWFETGAATSMPAPGGSEPDSLSAGWFENERAPRAVIYLLARGLFTGKRDGHGWTVGQAGAVSLALSGPPGFSTRTGVLWEPGGRAPVRLTALCSLVSPHYRLPEDSRPTDAAVIAAGMVVPLSGLRPALGSPQDQSPGAVGRTCTVTARLDGLLSLDWQETALLAGVPFTFRGLNADRFSVEVGVEAESCWPAIEVEGELGASVKTERQEAVTYELELDGSVDSCFILSNSVSLLLAARARRDSGGYEVETGVSLLAGPLEISGGVELGPGARLFAVDGLFAGVGLTVHAGPATFEGRVGLEHTGPSVIGGQAVAMSGELWVSVAGSGTQEPVTGEE